MDSIEKAIRNAFEKGDPSDRTFRERVYRQVLAALDRAIAANPDLAPDTAARRRDSLKATIVRIEREFLPARPAEAASPAAAAAPVSAADAMGAEAPGNEARRLEKEPPAAVRRAEPAPSLAGSRAPASAEAPPVGPASRDNDQFSAMRDDPGFLGGAFPDGPEGEGERVPAPDIDAPGAVGTVAPEERVLAGERRPARRRRRGFAIAFVVVTLAAACGIGIWWAGSTGLFKSAAERDTSVPNPPQDLEEEDFAPPPGEDGTAGEPPPLGEQSAAERDWIEIFSPGDPTAVTAPPDAVAEVAEEDGESYLRVRTGDSGEPVTFDIGQGVLEQLAGRTAVFAVNARAEDGQTTQIAVGCSLGALAECGRKRYLVARERTDYLFEIDLPQGAPGGGGTISIVSDVDGGGKAVEIFDIRVAVQ